MNVICTINLILLQRQSFAERAVLAFRIKIYSYIATRHAVSQLIDALCYRLGRSRVRFRVRSLFNWPNPSCRIMALRSTQPLTEMSTTIFIGVRAVSAWDSPHRHLWADCLNKYESIVVSRPYELLLSVTGMELLFTKFGFLKLLAIKYIRSIMPCSSEKGHDFGWIYRLHLQGRRVSQSRRRQKQVRSQMGYLVMDGEILLKLVLTKEH
jgi:hypothetical protein